MIVLKAVSASHYLYIHQYPRDYPMKIQASDQQLSSLVCYKYPYDGNSYQ